MTTSISIHHIIRLEILKEARRHEAIGRYEVLNLILTDEDKRVIEITVFGANNKSIEVKELPIERHNPIDYLEDGCVVATISNKYYVYIKALKTFIGLEDSFYLRDIADDLECDASLVGELDYSIKVVYKPGTVKALAPTETFSSKGIIAWARDIV